MTTKGNSPMDLKLNCPHCGEPIKIDLQLSGGGGNGGGRPQYRFGQTYVDEHGNKFTVGAGGGGGPSIIGQEVYCMKYGGASGANAQPCGCYGDTCMKRPSDSAGDGR